MAINNDVPGELLLPSSGMFFSTEAWSAPPQSFFVDSPALLARDSSVGSTASLDGRGIEGVAGSEGNDATSLAVGSEGNNALESAGVALLIPTGDSVDVNKAGA